MKQLVFGVMILVLAILVVISSVFLWNRQIRKSDFEAAVNTSMEQTMKCVEKGKGDIFTEEQMQKKFENLLKKQLNRDKTKEKNDNIKVEIRFLESDPEKGILSCEVREEFTYPSGEKGQLDYNRTILRERKRTRKLVTVELVGIRTYKVEAGERFDPGEVKVEGVKVNRWIDKNKNEIKFPSVINENMVLKPAV
jgi:hypothetical protein